MTQVDDKAPPTKEIPQIREEEDAPFPAQAEAGMQMDEKLGKMDDIDTQITKFRFLTGRNVLYIAMAAMGVTVLLDMLAQKLEIESDLITNSFEAFKLITTTVLGYIFGSSGTKSN